MTPARKSSYFTENIFVLKISLLVAWHSVLRNSLSTKRRTSSNVLRYFLYNYEYILYIKILSTGNVNFVYKYLLHTFILYCATILGYWALKLSFQKSTTMIKLFHLFCLLGFRDLLFKVIKNWALLNRSWIGNLYLLYRAATKTLLSWRTLFAVTLY